MPKQLITTKIDNTWKQQIENAQHELQINMPTSTTGHLLNILDKSLTRQHFDRNELGSSILKALAKNNNKQIIQAANNNLIYLGSFIQKDTDLDYNIAMNKFAYTAAASFTSNSHKDIVFYNLLSENFVNMLDCLLYSNSIDNLTLKHLQQLKKNNSSLAKLLLNRD